MRTDARYLEMLEKELWELPAGTQISYVGAATVTLRKVAGQLWELVNCNCGVTQVSNTYLATKAPEVDEIQERQGEFPAG